MARRKKPENLKPPSKDAPPPPVPKTANQKIFIDAIRNKQMIVAIGPAGTGKTFLSACYAGWYYKKGLINKIVLSRPTIPTGKSIGFFPGTLEEKMEPWVTPFIQALQSYLGKGNTEEMLKKGKIEIVPFEVLRGRTFDNSFVILDEAQNCTLEELKAFVTRHGENSTCIINGDATQTDLKRQKHKGLETIAEMVQKSEDLQELVEVVYLGHIDIVRSDLCAVWVKEFYKRFDTNT